MWTPVTPSPPTLPQISRPLPDSLIAPHKGRHEWHIIIWDHVLFHNLHAWDAQHCSIGTFASSHIQNCKCCAPSNCNVGTACSTLFLNRMLLRFCCKHDAGRVTRLECAALPAVQSRSTACSLAVMMNTLDCGTAESSSVPWLRSAATCLSPACIL